MMRVQSSKVGITALVALLLLQVQVLAQVTILRGEDNGSPLDFFGASVSANAGKVAVGAPLDETLDPLCADCGKVYVFSEDPSGDLVLEQILLHSNRRPADQFGSRVEVKRGRIFGGSPFHDGPNGTCLGCGSVFVFEETIPGTWTETAALHLPALESADNFGLSLAADPNTDQLVVGVPYDDGDGNSCVDCGAAYVFTLIAGEWNVSQPLRRDSPPGSTQLYRGWDLAVSGSFVALGLPGSSLTCPQCGEVELYIQIGGQWEFVQVLRPEPFVTEDQFGWSLALHGQDLVVGARLDSMFNGSTISCDECGTLYQYSYNGSSWDYTGRLHPDDFTDFGRYGHSVRISDDGLLLLVVSQYQLATSALGDRFYSGGGRIFSRPTTALPWVPEATIFVPSGRNFSEVGGYLNTGGSISSHGLAVLGYRLDNGPDGTCSSCGSAAVFRRNSPAPGTWGMCSSGSVFLEDGTCNICPAGFIDSAGDSYLAADGCTACDSGFSSDEGSVECSQCPEGQFSPDSGSVCQPCPVGYFSSSPGANACQPCPTGTFSDETGSTDCSRCIFGARSLPGSEVCSVRSELFLPGALILAVGLPIAFGCTLGLVRSPGALSKEAQGADSKTKKNTTQTRQEQLPRKPVPIKLTLRVADSGSGKFETATAISRSNMTYKELLQEVIATSGALNPSLIWKDKDDDVFDINSDGRVETLMAATGGTKQQALYVFPSATFFSKLLAFVSVAQVISTLAQVFLLSDRTLAGDSAMRNMYNIILVLHLVVYTGAFVVSLWLHLVKVEKSPWYKLAKPSGWHWIVVGLQSIDLGLFKLHMANPSTRAHLDPDVLRAMQLWSLGHGIVKGLLGLLVSAVFVFMDSTTDGIAVAVSFTVATTTFSLLMIVYGVWQMYALLHWSPNKLTEPVKNKTKVGRPRKSSRDSRQSRTSRRSNASTTSRTSRTSRMSKSSKQSSTAAASTTDDQGAALLSAPRSASRTRSASSKSPRRSSGHSDSRSRQSRKSNNTDRSRGSRASKSSPTRNRKTRRSNASRGSRASSASGAGKKSKGPRARKKIDRTKP